MRARLAQNPVHHVLRRHLLVLGVFEGTVFFSPEYLRSNP
jgi:hypothetical protein